MHVMSVKEEKNLLFPFTLLSFFFILFFATPPQHVGS